jgi:ABC-type uncharacterized transport system ATPase subunit
MILDIIGPTRPRFQLQADEHAHRIGYAPEEVVLQENDGGAHLLLPGRDQTDPTTQRPRLTHWLERLVRRVAQRKVEDLQKACSRKWFIDKLHEPELITWTRPSGLDPVNELTATRR